MRFTKGHILLLLLVVLTAYFLSVYQLDYYIQRPGGADALDPIVEVSGGYDSGGDMHLVTVSGSQATPIQYMMAKVLPHHDILPLNQVRPHGISEEQYMEAQLEMMESSQEASTVVAYQAAQENITIKYEGIYVVSVMEGMPADGKLQTGDRIIGVDGREVREATDLTSYVETKDVGETVSLEVVREEEVSTKELTLAQFDGNNSRAGIGISLVTDRNVEVDPEVNFSSGRIGGPSAGLMFSLEIYDQLMEDDITKGYHIGGTGEIDYDGTVYRIGGIDKKVVASDREGIDIFFAPNGSGTERSNYEVAKETAKEINTDMKIVPVKTFEDALDYLNQLEPKG
ncbi:SepM family pheromone-processing serine protease [Virgibacillus xinjiangensis]|uniref:endopeptidase La n=1 Tax=Virgibacillus xinjiangensis TaxID=393090 RepID=A0ABV7CV67_9BACI